jgi:hypothetical protein
VRRWEVEKFGRWEAISKSEWGMIEVGMGKAEKEGDKVPPGSTESTQSTK